MPLMSYQAIDRGGKTVTGEMEAASPEDVTEHLQGMGLFACSVAHKTKPFLGAFRLDDGRAGRKLSLTEQTILAEGLANLYSVGIPIDQALALLARTQKNVSFKSLLEKIRLGVREGRPLSESLSVTQALPGIFVSLLRAGEAGGGAFMKATMNQLSQYLAQEKRLQEKMLTALLYPGILVGMLFLSFFTMLLVVLPQFENIVQDAHMHLDLSAKVLFGLSHALRSYGLVIGLIATGLIVTIYSFGKKVGLRNEVEGRVLAIPFLGQVVRDIEISRFCQLLGVLQKAGIPLPEALGYVADSFQFSYYRDMGRRLAQKVREGALLSAAILQEQNIPDLTRRMIQLGDQSGELGVLLMRAGEMLWQDVEARLNRGMTMLTPLLTILIGTVIAFMMAVIMNIIMSMNDVTMGPS